MSDIVKKGMPIVPFFVLLFVTTQVMAGDIQKGKHAYEQALKAIENGRYYTAIGHLHTSIIHWPPATDDSEQIRQSYVPYLQLAYCYIYLNEFDTARVFYNLAQRRGVIYKIEGLDDLIQVIESNIAGSTLAETPKQQTPSPTSTESRATSEDCRVKPADDPYDLPWYFHYALARELLERGRFYEAARSIERALLKNPRPQPNARTYGMWFMAYRPYFILTRAYIGLNRINCARESAEKSRYYQEVPPNDPDAGIWREILRKLEGR